MVVKNTEDALEEIFMNIDQIGEILMESQDIYQTKYYIIIYERLNKYQIKFMALDKTILENFIVETIYQLRVKMFILMKKMELSIMTIFQIYDNTLLNLIVYNFSKNGKLEYTFSSHLINENVVDVTYSLEQVFDSKKFIKDFDFFILENLMDGKPNLHIRMTQPSPKSYVRMIKLQEAGVC